MIYDATVTNRIAKLKQQLQNRIRQIKVNAKREALRKREAEKIQKENEKALDKSTSDESNRRTI